jgi:hypothetical protein
MIAMILFQKTGEDAPQKKHRHFMSVFYDKCAADSLSPRIREFRQIEGFLSRKLLRGARCC